VVLCGFFKWFFSLILQRRHKTKHIYFTNVTKIIAIMNYYLSHCHVLKKQTFKWSPVCILFLVFYQGKFVEDTKGVIRIYKSKGRQLKIPRGWSEFINQRADNSMAKMKKDEKTNNGLQNTTQKGTDWATQTWQKSVLYLIFCFVLWSILVKYIFRFMLIQNISIFFLS
jgi:hypothetical protein